MLSSENDTVTDSETASQEPKVISETQSPTKTPPTQKKSEKPRSKTSPEAKEIMKILSSDKKLLEEVTADFEFNPPASSVEESQQEMQPKTKSKGKQQQPKKVKQNENQNKSKFDSRPDPKLPK